jgi:hypothetical protein
MLCLSIGLLVWRVIDGDSAVRIVVAAGLVFMWICLIAANRAARRKEASRVLYGKARGDGGGSGEVVGGS